MGVSLPRRGAAGGSARIGQGSYCVMDSLAQVLDGAPRACIDPGAERRAEEATGEVRRLCRIEGAGIVRWESRLLRGVQTRESLSRCDETGRAW